MNTLLICPSRRPAMRLLAEMVPLAQVPVLGQALVEYWLTHLACVGIKQVYLLANDRPEYLSALVGDGARWGLNLQVIPESRELTPAEALLKYEKELSVFQNGITVLDHLPGRSQHPLFNGYSDWFAAIHTWMPHAQMPDRVGVREITAGVWAGLHVQIAPTAQITAPCWLGKNVFVGPRAVVGPRAIIEDGSFIEADTEIVDSYIGPDTLVGQCVEIKESLACGSTLVNWRTGSAADVHDAFILCALRRPQLARSSLLQRVREMCAGEKEEDVVQGIGQEEAGLI